MSFLSDNIKKITFCRIANSAVFRAALQMPPNAGINRANGG